MEELEEIESISLAHTDEEPDAASSNDKPTSAENDEGTQELREDTGDTVLSETASDSVDTNTKLESTQHENEENKQEKTKKYTIGDGFEEGDKLESGDRRDMKKDEFPDYSTHSSNVEDLRARVFVGHLNTSECKKEDVVELFKPFGTIVGVNLQNGYGFVQYESEDNAKEAIKSTKGSLFFGQNIVVDRPAYLRKLEEAESRSQRRVRSHEGHASGSAEDEEARLAKIQENRDKSKGADGAPGRKDRSRSRSRSRDRKRSHSGERKTVPNYSTHSNNMDDLRARVFVGHLSTDECEKEDVVEAFKPFGTILGVNLQKGYGFVQFEEEDSAREAIKKLNGITFFGQKLVVDKPVLLRKKEEAESRSRSRNRQTKDLEEELEYLRRRTRYMDRHPRSDDVDKHYSDNRDRHYSDRDRDRYYRSEPLPSLSTPYYGDYADRADRYGGGGGGGGSGGSYDHYRGDDTYSNPYARASYGDPYGKPYPRRM